MMNRSPRSAATCVSTLLSLAGTLFLMCGLAAAQYTAPTTPVGQTSVVLTATVALPQGGSPASVAVLTKGAPNLDFTASGTESCTGQSYLGGQFCTVSYVFAPTSAGARQGAVVVKDGAGNVLGTSYIAGIGTAPLGLFSSPTQLWTVGGFGGPRGISVDGFGNVYVADTGANDELKMIPAGGGAPVNFLNNGVDPNIRNSGATAVDGAGNVYLAANNGNQAGTNGIYEVVNHNLMLVATLPFPNNPDDNLAVDGSGNLYGSDGNGAIYRISAAAGRAVTTLLAGNQNHRFIGLAVDPSGNIFAPDFSHNLLYGLPAGSNTLVPLATGGPLNRPHSVALDAAGNVYVGNLGGGGIMRYAAATFTETTLPADATASLAVDGAGNIYAVNGSNVVSYARTASPTVNFSSVNYGGTTTSGIGQPVTFENDGNADLIISSYAASSSFGIGASSTCGAGTMAKGTTCNLAASFTPQAAGALSGTLALTDNNLNVANAQQGVSLTGTGTPTTLTVTASSPTAVAGIVPVITASYSGFLLSDSPDSLATQPTCATTQSVNTAPGTAFVTSCSGGSAVNYTLRYVNGGGTIQAPPSSIAAPTTSVGQTTTSLTVWVNLSASGTLANVSYLSKGAPNLDFQAGAGGVSGACVPGQTYTVGQVCAVNYIFSPVSAGERQGAVVLRDAAGKVLGTAYINGVGEAPLGLFSSPVASHTITGFNIPRGLNFDGFGNAYVIDTGNNQVKEILAGTSTAVAAGTVPNSSNRGGGTVVDGAGNVYATSAQTSGLYRLAGGVATLVTTLPFQPNDNLDADGAGNLFATDDFGSIWEIPANNQSGAHRILTSSNHSFVGMGIDAAGNLYPADLGNSTLYELKVGSSSLTTLVTGHGMNRPHAVALDPAGNIYVSNLGGGGILRFAADSFQATTLSAAGSTGLAIDDQGDIYTILSGDTTIVEYARNTPPTSAFAATTYGATRLTPTTGVVEFENDGNADLVITGYAASSSYGAAGTGNTCAAGTLVSGATCLIGASFSPAAVGDLPGALTLTDNNLNQAGAQQELPLDGTGTAANLTITASGGTMTYGGVVPVISATATGLVNGDTLASLSGLVCTTTATGSAVGTYTTSCSGVNDLNYNVNYASGTFSVTPAALTVTASSASMSYGGTVPVIAGTTQGLVNGDTLANLSGLACSTTATSTSPVGAYPSVCAHGSDSNYTITYVNGSVSVVAASLTVTASSSAMTYGGGVPAITASYSGFVNGDSPASLTSLPTCSTTAMSSSGVGSYASSCAGAAAANYAINYTPGSVMVNPAPLGITASGASMTYGGSGAPITASYSGFVNGDTAASLTAQPTCSTIATSASSVGTYASSCSGAAAANYAITYTAGSVTVSPAALAITASGGAMTYGGALPVITAGYRGFVNNDAAASLTSQPTCSTAATSASGVGTYASSCSGASAVNYTITYAAGSVTISPATLVITASGASAVYGAGVPAITASYGGFVNGDGSASLTTQPTCSTTATGSSAAGTYPSTCSGAVDANYSFSYVAGTITIGQAPLTITASGASTIYGSVPVTTASFSGFVNGDSSTSLTTQPTCSTAASSSSAAGTYPTSCSGAADPNYSISYVAGVITVGQAPLAITASGGSMTYGGSVPSITASFGGFVNGDTAASLTTRPTCSTIATSSTGVGNYASSCTGAADANYAISYSGGSVTVSPAPLTVVVNNFSRAFGAADAFTGTITGAVNGDVITAGYSAGDTATSNVGTYTIIATLASSPAGALSNYTVSNTPGTLTVNKANQTISFTAPNADPYGTMIPLSASASSALPVSLSLVSGPATLVNGTLTLTGTGAVVVEADQTGNGNWNAAPAIRATINATQAVLTVTANNQSCVYGTCDGDFDSDDASHQVSYSITGLVGSDTISGRARLTTNTPEGGPVGTYAITVNQGTLTASSNYSFRLVNGTLTITPAVLTVKAKNVTFTYGGHGVGHGDEGDRCESDHGRDDGECGFGHLGYTVTGLVNGDSPRVFGGQPALSTTATQNSPAGLYPILLGIGSFHASTNYVVQLVNGMVIVNKAVLTVEANNLSRPVNTANPPLTYSFDGFENGDNAAVLGGAPALTTTALITSPAGAYPIAIAFGTLTSANYTFAFQNGQLRVGHGDGDHGEGDHRDDSHHNGHDH